MLTQFKDKHLAGGYLAINKSTIEQLPFPLSISEQQQPIISLVETILEKKRNGEPTEDEERKIDLLVYHLYDLTYDEVKVVAPEDTNDWLTEEIYKQYE